MGQNNKFNFLKSLDLSDNDIYGLIEILQPLSSLESLSSLQLEGNPCAMCVCYKNVILRYLPNLSFLDQVQIAAEDKKNLKYSTYELHRGSLIFTCHRIIGLPKPPKQKKIVQTIHLEIKLPLLEDIDLTIPIETDNDVVTFPETPKSKKGKGSQSSKKGKASKILSPYLAQDEYQQEQLQNISTKAFKTDRVPWQKIITLPQDAIVVESPEQDLMSLRDTFRSTVRVKVIYLEVIKPVVKKKPKSAKGKLEEVAIPVETIQKKVTLANFLCDLHSINWSDETIDYYWSDHPQCGPKGIAIEGSLRDIVYAEGKKVPKGVEPAPQKLPKNLTCQVGFGLKRSYSVR